jgi:hypothetical protein
MAHAPSFTAVVNIDGINPYVDVPPAIVRQLGTGKPASVLVRVAGRTRGTAAEGEPRAPAVKDAGRLRAIRRLSPDGWFRTTLVSRHRGAKRLYLDTWMRESASAGVGSRVRVTLKPDDRPRVLPTPPVLREALAANPDAAAAWRALAPSRRREILSYLNFLKSPAALERNVRKTIAVLSPTRR